jgi:UDP-glucuronate decarboxylase
MRRILVTGGAGFIGRHLCRRLLDDGHEVVCIDDFSTGNMDEVKKMDGLRWHYFDVRNPIGDTFGRFDEIYNLACPASPDKYRINPVKTLETSFLGAKHVLEVARKYDCKVLQASTSEVYGSTPDPMIEGNWGLVNPIGPRACYDEGKRVAEALFMDFRRMYSTKIKIARIFNTYGPGMAVDDGRVISNFIVQALKNEPLHVYGSRVYRGFCYISDMVEALVRLMDTKDSVTGPINLGNPELRWIDGLAKEILEATESECRILVIDPVEDDQKIREPKIFAARKLLQWKPEVKFEDGLARTIAYFREELA